MIKRLCAFNDRVPPKIGYAQRTWAVCAHALWVGGNGPLCGSDLNPISIIHVALPTRLKYWVNMVLGIVSTVNFGRVWYFSVFILGKCLVMADPTTQRRSRELSANFIIFVKAYALCVSVQLIELMEHLITCIR